MRSTSTVMRAAGALACAAFASAQSWKTIPPIEAYGQHFFYSNNGSQFYIKGVAYQQDFAPNGETTTNSSNQYTDPLTNGANCARDIPYMTKIFTNTIRVYALDPTEDHDDCMQQLADAGIYVFADLSQPGLSIQTDDPEWNVPLYERYASVVNAMSKYNNMAGFFAGNEVVNLANQSDAAAFVKAAVRDTKAYIKSQGYRSSMGVGYATSDVPTRDDLAAYFACGDSDSMIDFWGYNVYSWCGDSSYTASSYDERVKFFSDYPVPVFFAEYGCNQGITGGPYRRPFTEVPVLFGPKMSPVFSGGIVFEYFDGPNQFGLVKVDGNDVTPYPDYSSLSSELAKVTPSITQKSNYSPTNSALACPTDASWSAVASPLPPSPNSQFCDCEESTFSCVITSDDETKYGAVFGFICGENPDACAGFQHNATSGKYGALSGCSPKVQLGWAANQYYSAQKNNPSACDFSGIASVTSAGTASGCASLLADVASNGSGSVPSPTGSAGGSSSGSGSGSGSDGGAASSAGRARPNAGLPHTSGELGMMYVAAYVGLAFVSGMGMLFL